MDRSIVRGKRKVSIQSEVGIHRGVGGAVSRDDVNKGIGEPVATNKRRVIMKGFALSVIIVVFLTFVHFVPAEGGTKVRTVQYQVAGATGDTVEGDGGLRHMNVMCQEFLSNPQARVCTSEELMESPDLSIITGFGGWVQPVISGAVVLPSGAAEVIDMASGLHSGTLNCDHWHSTTGNGLVWENSHLSVNACTTVRRVICCTPEVTTGEVRKN